MKVSDLKAGNKLANVLLEDEAPIVTQEPVKLYEYADNKRTDKVKGYRTDLVLINQNFNKVICITKDMPRLFLGQKIQEPVKVHLVNPIAEVTYTNEIRLLADDIMLADEVIDL